MTDGPDYTTYTLDELLDARRNIDAERLPDRVRELDAEIVRRESLPTKAPVTWEFPELGKYGFVVLAVAGIVLAANDIGSAIAQVGSSDPSVEQLEAFGRFEADVDPVGGAEWIVELTAALLSPPAWWRPWVVTTGIVRLLSAAVWFVGCVWILRRRSSGFRLLIGGLIVAVSVAAIGSVVFPLTFPIPMLFWIPTAAFDLVPKLGLLGAAIAVRKRGFA